MDLIDRQEAIKAMSCLTDSICEGEAVEALCELPTIEPEHKPGRWLRIKGEQEYVCQECGQRCLETIMSLPKWDYCPNCGAYNGGDEDETQP